MQMSIVKSHRTVTNFSFSPDLLLIFLKCKCLFCHLNFTITTLVKMFYVIYKQNKSSTVNECWSTYTPKLLENLPHTMCKSNSSVKYSHQLMWSSKRNIKLSKMALYATI